MSRGVDGDRVVVSCRMALGGALLAALVIRCLAWRNFVNPDGGFYFYSIDAYDHLRRITLGVNRFPALADFDFYAAFPHGLGQIWAPGFDYLLAAICRLAGGGRAAIETICFFFNPVAAALAVLLIFCIARVAFKSEVAAAVAALLLALHPAYIAYSLPMNFDHHAVEPLVALLLFALPLLERQGRLRLVGMGMAVGSLLLAIILWRGSTLYWGLAFISALGRVVIGNNRPAALAYSLVFGVVALVLAVYCLIDPWGGAGQLSFGLISWFHVVLLAGWAGILLLYGVCRTRRRFFGWLAAVAVLAFVAMLNGPLAGMVGQVLGGLSFVRGQGDPWLESNSELRGVFQSRYGLWYSVSYLTGFWFLAPVAIVLGLRKWRQGGCVDAALLNFMVWSPLLAMGFIIRYSHIAGVFMSLAGGFLVAELWNGWTAKRSRWLLLAALLLLLLPGLPHFREAMTADLPAHQKFGLHGEQGLLAWLRHNTPATSHWSNPVEEPEYGVLARWSLGAQIYQVAQRPSLSTAFGWETYGFYQEAGFWVAEEESKALAMVRPARVRYVVAQAVHDLQSDFALVAQGQARGDLPPDLAGHLLRPERTMHARLMQGDGSVMKVAGGMLPALESLRLVYESRFLVSAPPGGGSDLSYYKVFEVVQGAVITGKVASSEPIILMLELQTTRQRKLTYLNRVYAGPEGTFRARVPYATTGQQGDSRPLADYKVYVGRELKGTVAVSEDAVVNGKTVSLD